MIIYDGVYCQYFSDIFSACWRRGHGTNPSPIVPSWAATWPSHNGHLLTWPSHSGTILKSKALEQPKQHYWQIRPPEAPPKSIWSRRLDSSLYSSFHHMYSNSSSTPLSLNPNAFFCFLSRHSLSARNRPTRLRRYCHNPIMYIILQHIMVALSKSGTTKYGDGGTLHINVRPTKQAAYHTHTHTKIQPFDCPQLRLRCPLFIDPVLFIVIIRKKDWMLSGCSFLELKYKRTTIKIL